MGIGLTEGLLIVAIAIFFFGGKKLPELGKTFGASIKNFKEGMKEDSSDKDSNQKKKDS